MTSNQKRNLLIDTLIFEIDGVLIDVSKPSYQAIIQTIELFFTRGLGFLYKDRPSILIDQNDIDSLRMAGGLGNDWEISTTFISYFLEMLPPVDLTTQPLRKHVPDILAYLQIAGSKLRVSMDVLKKNKNIPRLARQISKAGGGLNGVDKVLKRRNRHLLSTGTDPLTGNLIQRIFQELYFGERLFEKIYDQKAIVVQTPGLISQETLLIDPKVLKKLASHLTLAIATERPRPESEYTLRRFGIHHYFQTIITYNDIVESGATGKPAPWLLQQVVKLMEPRPTYCAYIDRISDGILAAKHASQTAPFITIGSLAASRDKQQSRRHFEKSKADIILGHPNQLERVIFRSTTHRGR